MNDNKIRVLQVFGATNRGGAESMLMNIYRQIDRDKVQFDFLKHTSSKCDFDDEIIQLGGRLFSVPKLKGYNIVNYILSLRKLFLDHPEWKIIHVHHFKVAAFVLWVAKICGIKNRIAHSHNTSISFHGTRFIVILKSLGFKVQRMLLQQVVTERYACGKLAGKFLWMGRDFYVINNAIDTKKFAFSESVRKEYRTEFNFTPDNLVIGHVGRFDREKNHSFIVDMFMEVLKINPQARLLLVGYGYLFNEIKDIIKKNGISDKVILTGMRNDVHKIINAMDIMVLPSLLEGLPVIFIESQSNGVPILTTDKITTEVDFSNLIIHNPLAEGPHRWAELICNITINNDNRENAYLIVKENHYDIIEVARDLQERYINMNC